MDKIKSIVIFVTILLCLIVIIIFTLRVISKKIDNVDNETLIKESFEVNNKLERISDIDEYIFIKECINKYINYSENLKNLTDEDDDITIENTISQLKSIIPEFVIEDLNIKDKELYEKLGVDNKAFRLNNIYRSLQTLNKVEYEEATSIYAYYVEGIFIDKLNYEKKDFNIIIILDKINETFLIIPELYIANKNIDINRGEQLKIYTQDVIENNFYNVFYMRVVSQEDKCQSYISDFKNNLTYDVEYVFNNILDNKYRDAKFEDINQFKMYINQKYGSVNKISFQKYDIEQHKDYKQYICIDQNENYYIFREKDIMEYSIILDTYTIDLPEFIEKYNNSDEQSKVALNISKFITAINYKDYNYSYGILAESFKQNKYPNIETFKKFVQENLYENNDIQYREFTQQGSNYIYKIKITNKDSNEEKDMTIVMKLYEGTEFEMSFSME